MRRAIPAGMEDESASSDEDFGIGTGSTDKARHLGTQQTCLLSVPQPVSSKKKEKAKQYFEALKLEKKLGPVARPQDDEKNYNFYVESVKRNLGLPREVITGENEYCAKYQVTPYVKMSNIKSRRPLWVSNSDDITSFIQRSTEEPELAVDLECNNDHSYQGMTCLVQISTCSEDLLVDPFPNFYAVKDFLGTLLAKSSTLKVFCGGANDFINIRRDFCIAPALCVDIQILDKLIRGVPVKSEAKGLKELCKLYLKIDLPKGETNRDWRRRPLPDDMMLYAQSDTYYTLAVYQEMKANLNRTNNSGLIRNAIMHTATMIQRAEEILDKKKEQRSLTEYCSFRDVLLHWRLQIAKLVDDAPKNILSDSIIDRLISNTPETIPDLKKMLGPHERIIKENVIGLHRLLKERRDFFSQCACHKCGVMGHSAIQCDQKVNRQLEKDHLKEHPEKKTHQNRRRNQRKKLNKQLKMSTSPSTSEATQQT